MTIENSAFVKAEIMVRRKPSEVFSAFNDAAAMSKYWFTRRDQGLREGDTVTWFVGSGPEAPTFDVNVRNVLPPNKIVFEWENGGQLTQVTVSIKERKDGNTDLKIEETGFKGSEDAVLAWALDSTGGFNQVIVAAKLLIEHGVGLNVVADHV